jgi:hypothetical protein
VLLFTSLSGRTGFGENPEAPEPQYTVYGDGDSAGGSTSGRDWQNDDLMLQQYQLPAAGKVVSILPWIRTGTGLLRACAYADDAGEPGDLLSFAEFDVVSAPDDFLEIALDPSDHFDVAEDLLVWLGVQADGSKGSRTAQNPAALARRIEDVVYESGPPDPAPAMSAYSANRPLRIKIWTNPP